MMSSFIQSNILFIQVGSAAGLAQYDTENIPEGLKLNKIEISIKEPNRYQREFSPGNLPPIVSAEHPEMIEIRGKLGFEFSWKNKAAESAYLKSQHPIVVKVELLAWPLVEMKEFANHVRESKTLAEVSIDKANGEEKIVWHLEQDDLGNKEESEMSRRRNNCTQEHIKLLVFVELPKLPPNSSKTIETEFEYLWKSEGRKLSPNHIWVIEGTSSERKVLNKELGVFQTAARAEQDPQNDRRFRLFVYHFLNLFGWPADPFDWFR
jgi:hypothetical protein